LSPNVKSADAVDTVDGPPPVQLEEPPPSFIALKDHTKVPAGGVIVDEAIVYVLLVVLPDAELVAQLSDPPMENS
jgi:hypothetical protein